MIEVKIHRGILKRRIPYIDKVVLHKGINWIKGVGGSGKTTLLQALYNFPALSYNKEVQSDIELPASKLLLADFEKCTCSDVLLNEHFQMLRETSSSEEARIDFLELLLEHVQSKSYELILLDNPLNTISHINIDSTLNSIQVLSTKAIVVASYNGSLEFSSGHTIQLKEK